MNLEHSTLEQQVASWRESGFPKPWQPDLGDGTYQNPVLHADYSDPDVICVGDDYWMTASSMNHIPGLPLLHSKDLVNWRLVQYAMPAMTIPGYDKPRHGSGIWAPSIRFHDGLFHIFVPTPDEGIFVTSAKDPAGEWSPFRCLLAGRGYIDPCPLWDDDGTAWLIFAFARSRIGFKSVIAIAPMTPDAQALTGEYEILFDGRETQPTLEGPKIYKRNGLYYIFAPAGGVQQGWQVILRAPRLRGPYEEKIVLHQGSTDINGPHQGGWVETPQGEHWFLHFQDKDAFGRVVHLQPMYWEEDWPVMGIRHAGQKIGEPVRIYRKPACGFPQANIAAGDPEARLSLEASDDFTRAGRLSLQWQWSGNPHASWFSLEENPGSLRLFPAPALPIMQRLGDRNNLLMQKFIAPRFHATAKFEISDLKPGVQFGLVLMAQTYRALAVEIPSYGASQPALVLLTGDIAVETADSSELVHLLQEEDGVISLYLQAEVREVAVNECLTRLRYSLDGETWIAASNWMVTHNSLFTGCKVGVFGNGPRLEIGSSAAPSMLKASKDSHADIDWFVVE